VRLSFAENGSSKVGVRFDKQIPGGIDLGGNCELDHGLFCSGMFHIISCISISLDHCDYIRNLCCMLSFCSFVTHFVYSLLSAS